MDVRLLKVWMALIIVINVCGVQKICAQTVRDAPEFPGNDAGEKINNCVNALLVTGGVCNARGLGTTLGATLTVRRTIVINKGITLLLPCGTIASSASPIIDIAPESPDATVSA